MKTRIALFGTLFLLAAAGAQAGTIEKKYPDGAIKLKYEISSEGDKEGSYEEFYPSGKAKVKAQYKADKLAGPYQSFHENGKPNVTATYKDGQLSGAYTEHTDNGAKKLTATYKDGKLDGTLTKFDNGKPAGTQVYKDGAPAYRRSLEEIKKNVWAIMGAPPKAEPDYDAALRRLKAYRYLAELPYENLQLDAEMAKSTLAAAQICEKLKEVTHFPKNPGLPEAEYKIAANGCAHSNIGFSFKIMYQAVDAWMWDSDPSNIERLGHRRWCLNPTMAKTGFGGSNGYVAMWSHDRSQKTIPDIDMVCWPPRGLAPVNLFPADSAWSVSFNPQKFRPVPDSVLVRIVPIDESLSRGEPLKLNWSKPNKDPFSWPACLVFRPDKSAVAVGKRYVVEIEGLVRADGKPAATISYMVEFCSIR
jgi:hypothetical protein